MTLIVSTLLFATLTVSIPGADNLQNTNSLDSLIDSSVKQINDENYEQALELLYQAKAIATKQEDVDKLSDVRFNIGLVHYYLNNYDASVKAFNEALTGFIDNNRHEAAINCYRMVGYVFNVKGFNQQAMYNYLQALNIALTIQDKKLIADMQILMGLLYKEMEDYENAIVNFVLALDYCKSSGDFTLQANALNNLGISYHALNNHATAKAYYLQALEIKRALRDSVALSTTTLNLGELFLDQGQFDSAIVYLYKSVELQRSSPDRSLEVAANNLLGETYRRSEQYDKSKMHLEAATNLLTHLESRRHSLDNFKYLKALAFDLKDYRQSLYWDTKYDSLSDLYFEEEKLKTQQIESNYHINQEKQKNEALEIQKQQQEELASLRLWMVIVLGFIVVTIILLLLKLKIRNKEITALNSDLEGQNKLINALSKNNFHFSMNIFDEMKSMFAYQSLHLDGKDKVTFNKISSTINTTARLFKYLLQTHDQQNHNEQRDIKPFLEEVIQDTLDTFGLENIATSILIEPILLKADKMYSLGQIMNELIINSAKYAFSNGKESGTMDISLKEVRKAIQLDYKDNGPGMNLSTKKEGSLGMDLIKILSKSLQGKFENLEVTEGVHFRICIPLQKNPE